MDQVIVRRPFTGSNTFISVGKVGSVGDTNATQRLNQSTPEMPIRTLEWTTKNPLLGSYVGTMEPRIMSSNWSGNRTFDTAVGYRFKNVEYADKTREPVMLGVSGTVGGYPADTRAANVWDIKRTGKNFLPNFVGAPFVLPPGQLPRGGSYPRITNVMGTDDAEVEGMAAIHTATLVPRRRKI